MDYLELFVDAFEAIIHFSFLIIILSQKSENVIYWWIKFTGCVLVYTCVSYFIISKYDLFIGEEVLLIIMLYAASEFLCRGYRFQKLSFCLLSCIITTISSLITSIVVPILLESPVSDVLQQDGSQVRLVALAFAKTTQILLSLIVILITKTSHMKMWPCTLKT